jgi:hypothetical protein
MVDSARPRLLDPRTDVDVLLLDVMPETLETYSKAILKLNVWLAARSIGPVLDFAESDPGQFVAIVAEYLRRAFVLRTLGPSQVGHLLSGLSRELTLRVLRGTVSFQPKATMQVLWRMLAAWRKNQPVEMRVPVPRRVVLAIIVVLIARGTGRALRAACCVGLMVHCICRPDEVLSCLWSDVASVADQDVVIASSQSATVCGIFAISKAKTRHSRKHAALQHVTILCPMLLQFVTNCRVALGDAPHEMLWPHTAAAFRQEWDNALAVLGLSSLPFLPGGMRGAGAILHY